MIPALVVLGDADDLVADVLGAGLAVLRAGAEEPYGIALAVVLVLVLEVFQQSLRAMLLKEVVFVVFLMLIHVGDELLDSGVALMGLVDIVLEGVGIAFVEDGAPVEIGVGAMLEGDALPVAMLVELGEFDAVLVGILNDIAVDGLLELGFHNVAILVALIGGAGVVAHLVALHV